MFFKRIEMTGFKSFATKTVVDFKPGVTIVVGPNGCGKSNIFDAIRWVLGEQSAKSLRGSKMGDVIFQGSATYKPMGCSQVTLVINNEGRRLPIDYSEISITRRLYRSGESEYQLNKSPCRLRDLQELFLDTGIGTDSYSTMEQGRVGDIIKSRPEDRRELFEEAAGVSKYKIRKVEALRKLELTEQDLLRLADRVAEAGTRSNSLKRQAAKAERYKELKDAADGVEMKLLTLELSKINTNIEGIEREYRESKDQLAVVRAENDTVQARREELLLQMQDADDTLRDLSMQREDQRQYITSIGQEVSRLKNLAENEWRRAGDINKQFVEIDLRAGEASNNLAEINAEEARLTVRLITLQARQNIRRAEYERMRSDSAATRKKIASLRKSTDENAETLMRLRNERNRLQLRMEMSNAAVEDFNRQKQEHQLALANLNSQIDECRQRLDDRTKDLKQLQANYEKARLQAEEEDRARGVLRGEHRTAEKELHEAASRLKALERLAKDYAGYFDGVRAVMRASEDHQLDGIIGVVPELIQSIDAEHDLAIEIALGNNVQNIVTRSAQETKRAIEYLRSEQKGRATFLPLDLVETRDSGHTVDQALNRPGVIGLASNLVTYDRYIERVVTHLLNRTIVVENMDVSLHLMRQGLRVRYVTLDGQLTSPGGSMTGGSNRGRSQIISRQREITELATQSRELTEREADLARRMERRDLALANLAADGERIRSQIGDIRLELGSGETQLAALRDIREERKTAFAHLQTKSASNETNTKELTDALDKVNVQITALEESLEGKRAEMSEMEEAVYDHNTKTDQMGDHVNQIDKDIVRLTQQCHHLRERAESSRDERAHWSRSRSSLLLEQDRGRQEAQRHLEQAARVEGEKLELEQEVSQIAALCERAAKTKEKAQQAIGQEGNRSQRLLSDLTRATNRYNEAQEHHLNAQSDIKRLRERAEDRFGRSLEEIAEETGEVTEERVDLAEELADLRVNLNRMGDNINMGALVEFKEAEEHHEFLIAQEKDLMKARDSLRETIATIDKTTGKLFWDAFEAIRENFILVYRQLFGGGKADLVLLKVEDGDQMLEGGVEIVAQPPGKKLQSITLLSGGEQALTAVSLMFAIFMYKPSPFCVMDEIDAPLDDANVMRFREMLQEFARDTQFIIITHNKITMDLADTIYGITMQETGVSSLVSVAFDQVDQLHASGAAS